MDNIEPTIKNNSGFSLVEMLVVLAIIGIVTVTLLLSRNSFDNTIVLTNEVYEVASTIREAQEYGISVRGATIGSVPTTFTDPYVVEFDINDKDDMKIFVDLDGDRNKVDDEVIIDYDYKHGVKLNSFCSVSGINVQCSPVPHKLFLAFQRPKLDVQICHWPCDENTPSADRAEIVLESLDGEVQKKIVVLKTGSISVEDVASP